MPGNYAHYRFGIQLMEGMTPEQQRSVGRFRQLYEMGLHGPDILYYADPLGIGSSGKLGRQFHSQTGISFFEHACRAYRLRPSEGGEVYLYGLLAHYTLDSTTAPFIDKSVVAGKRSRRQIEAEFDRYLLSVDGKKPLHKYDCSRHISLTPGEAEVAAAFYPGVNANQLRKFAANMARCTHMLAMDAGSARDLKLKSLQIAAPETAQRVIPIRAHRNCYPLNQSLLRLTEMANTRYFVLLEGLRLHVTNSVSLTTDFAATFGE